jgi:hypothetical protein
MIFHGLRAASRSLRTPVAARLLLIPVRRSSSSLRRWPRVMIDPLVVGSVKRILRDDVQMNWI